jgi:aminopeptidase-like protein/aminoglycoside N3'-acetyltransferase
VGARTSASSARYTAEQLQNALAQIGVSQGDTLFVHANLDALGALDGAATPEDTYARVLQAIRAAVGAGGTIVVPTYTFSFCRQEDFDPARTPTRGGPWSPSAGFLEYFRAQPDAVRSRDPIHSVAAAGPRAQELVADIPPTCFGADSVFARLEALGAKVCLLGLPLEEATIRHHTEEMVGVPFRFRKLFTGRIITDGEPRKTGWIYSVRIMADAGFPDGRRLEALAREAGVCRAASLGSSEVLGVEAKAYLELTTRELTRDPWLTARGPKGDPVALEDARVGACRPTVQLPRDASMAEMIDGLWRLPRHIVSDAYDAALDALATQLPMTIHEYPTGSECWSWLIPEKWVCHEAYLETLDGQRLFSHADNPLHVISYSLPFEGEVSREVLLEHLHVHPVLDDAIPFIFKYYERDWGLCCSRALRDTLTDERYRVVIRTSFSFGTLKVGEIVAPGRSDECIVLCAHLCHPAMVNDDLSGVVVGMDVMRTLLARRDRRYTYRYIIVPETIGSIAWLSRNEELIPRMRGGLFLEMLGIEGPHALQLSLTGDTEIDRAFTRALMARDPANWTGPFRTIIGNDERQFNAPGVRVPMLSLSRVRRPTDPMWPYPEYHSNHDSPEITSAARLEDSRDTVLAMIDALEGSAIPTNRFRGEVFCSRYGIHVDAYANPDGHRALFDIMYLIDGTRSVAAIAEACGITVDAALGTIRELERHGLVEL